MMEYGNDGENCLAFPQEAIEIPASKLPLRTFLFCCRLIACEKCLDKKLEIFKIHPDQERRHLVSSLLSMLIKNIFDGNML